MTASDGGGFYEQDLQRRYKERIDNNEITVEEAIELAQHEVSVKWRSAVIEMLEALN